VAECRYRRVEKDKPWEKGKALPQKKGDRNLYGGGEMSLSLYPRRKKGCLVGKGNRRLLKRKGRETTVVDTVLATA